MFLRVLIIIILLLHTTYAKEDYIFVIIPKTQNSSFFKEVEKGCESEIKKLTNVKYIFHGADTTNPIEQVKIIEYYIKQRVDGIAISVIDSQYLIKSNVFEKAKQANVPIITFDSDISSEASSQRLAYIGTDNFEFGKRMGETLKKLRPQGGTLCIQSGWKNSKNLQRRIDGIRYILHGNTSKLDYYNGWKEIERCPLYCRDDSKLALFQMEWAFNESDAIISVGVWLQNDDSYEEHIRTLLPKLQSNEKTLLVADTTPKQLELLEKKLAFINIGQNPFMMGKESIKTLYKIVNNQPFEEFIYTPLTYCTQENYKTCTYSE